MNKNLLLSFAFSCVLSVATRAQFDASQVKFWVGSGPDSSILVIDFLDASFEPSYAWGYLHDGATAEQMIADIDAADINLSIVANGGFLSDIIYNTHTGIGGTPNYWGTWSGTDISSFAMNNGLSETLTNGSWFGCSYTNFDPALSPTEPLAAFDPDYFVAADVTYWIGEGTNSAVLIVDFQDGTEDGILAWGYRFNGTVTGEQMINDIAGVDAFLSAVISGGFLNDIVYNNHEGLVGNPNYWGTWSGTNLGNLAINMGVSTDVPDGSFFGCSYTDFAPALRPGYPQPAEGPTFVETIGNESIEVYPSPAHDILNVVMKSKGIETLQLFDVTGALMKEVKLISNSERIDVSMLPSGVYILQSGDFKKKIIVQ